MLRRRQHRARAAGHAGPSRPRRPTEVAARHPSQLSSSSARPRWARPTSLALDDGRAGHACRSVWIDSTGRSFAASVIANSAATPWAGESRCGRQAAPAPVIRDNDDPSIGALLPRDAAQLAGVCSCVTTVRSNPMTAAEHRVNPALGVEHGVFVGVIRRPACKSAATSVVLPEKLWPGTTTALPSHATPPAWTKISSRAARR